MAEAFVPIVGTVPDELVPPFIGSGGDTAAQPTHPENAEDRNAATVSLLPAGLATGIHTWYWIGAFSVAVTPTRIRVWQPLGAGNYWHDPTNAIVEYSDNSGSTWSSAVARTYSSATVSSGLSFPSPTTLTEYRYDITSPSSHKWWRIRQTAGAGLDSGRGMSELFFDGSSIDPGSLEWVAAADTIDGSDASSDDVDEDSIAETAGPFWRYNADGPITVQSVTALLGFADTGSVTVLLQGATEADFSDAVTVATLNGTATGSLADDEYDAVFDPQGPYEFWQLVLDSAEQDVRVFEVTLEVEPEGPGPTVPPGHEPSKAILEIYVHDEDASRWGEATWATGPATGTEGIWSAAGWQNVTPEGVNVHVMWGSRRPERGILAEQTGASWNVQTYDPDRILDPGNQDSPYYPQLVAGVPIRISHEATVIRTGYIDEFHYKAKSPDYQGQLLASDTIALLNQASVPADSILGNTLLERIQDAINAAGIAVGGIPLPPGGPAGPTIADWEEGAATDDPTTVWQHILSATQEVLWVAYVDSAAGIGLRSWGAPLDRGREITAPNLEDLESVSHEDGLYSVVTVQVEDPDADPITRVAAPLPRYGRRVFKRDEPTIDPEGFADAILSDRAWPGVGYVPGTIHCFTKADVDYFGSLEIMERVTITVPGIVSVTGRILGGELHVEHRQGATKGATWMFHFSVATDGSSAIGLTTLVADGTGEVLLDDDAGTEYLEAD